MHKTDDILTKNYRKIKEGLISTDRCCPKEELLWDYAKGALKKKEHEKIERHILSCDECIESLRVIRMLLDAQESPPLQVPEGLHKRAQEILQDAQKAYRPRPKGSLVIHRLALLWDQALGKVTQLTSDLGGLTISPSPAFQPVRRTSQTLKDFPFTRGFKIDEGKIFIEIDRSGKEGYLSLRASIRPDHPRLSSSFNNVRAVLYKSNRLYASVFFDKRGEALFTRIKEGKYAIEFLTGERSLGMLELYISKGKK